MVSNPSGTLLITEDILRNIEYTLGGYIINEKGDKVKVANAAYLNDEGVVKVMSVLRSHVDRNIYLSQFDKKFIVYKSMRLYFFLYKMLIRNRNDFEIRSTDDIQLILECIDTAVVSAMFHALLGKEGEMHYGSLSQQAMINQQQQNQPKVTL